MSAWPRVAALVLLGLLLTTSAAWAVYPPAIKDDGKFFKADTLEKANRKIREIYEKYNKDVVVETIASLTADQEKKADEEGKGKFFPKLALERSRTLGVHGIYIVIVKKPQYLQIHMDPETQKKTFTATHRTALRERIISRFKEEDFDGGLTAGLEQIAQTLEKTK